MVFSYYLYKYPYKICWFLAGILKKKPEIVFYCADHLDYIIFEPIQKYLPKIPIVARNKKIQNVLKKGGIESKILPLFPRAVIMTRHALHKFPEKKIVKIGMRHGAYHFKKMISKDKYNAFDLFFLTSKRELEIAEQMGISSAKAIGFPKIDQMFDKSINRELLNSLKKQINLDNDKSTILFSSTWDKSGLSAIDKWFERLNELTEKYNILVTVHPWTSNHKIKIIKQAQKVFFIENKNILPYLILADILVSDTSSIIAEFNALLKPIITFKIDDSPRLTDEIKTIIIEISTQIESFEELKNKIKFCLDNPQLKLINQQKYNKIMFDELDGKAGKRAADEIKKLLKNKKIL